MSSSLSPNAPLAPPAPDVSSPVAAPPDRWPLAWVGCTAAALVAMAWWQQEPGWGRLATACAGVGLSAWFLPQVRRPRTWAGVAVLALVVACLLAGTDTATLVSIRTDWPRWSAAEREARASRVEASLSDVGATLRAAVEGPVTDSAFVARILADDPPTLAPPMPSAVESALLVYRDTRLLTHVGQTHTPVAPGAPVGLRLVDGPFHTSLVARARDASGRVEVVAVALVSSAPPADRFARSLLQSLSGNLDVAHTTIESPDSTVVDTSATVVLVPDGPLRLARVHATTYTEGETRLQFEQRARMRTGLALAVAMCAFLVAAWRRPAWTLERSTAAIAVLSAVGMMPLPGLSNVSPLFDPRAYFAPMGGSLTSTIGALLITAMLVLAVVLFALRASLRTTLQRAGRVGPALMVLALAVGGPFLLRDLARGIALPGSGAGFTLWIAWQLALALVGVAVLLLGASAGQAALGTRRGLPPGLSVLVALAAGVLAPVLWEAPGAWPVWYPALWIGAVGTLALTRRGLAQVLAAAVVAGSGAATLTWGATVRARIALAQYDLARVGEEDPDALRLLERFAIGLREEVRPVQTSEALLRRYASSELARAGYGARLARWSPASLDVPVSQLELVPVRDSLNAQAWVALQARESGTVEFRTLREGIRTHLVAAVPAPDGVVTTVTLPPRTSLLPADPFSTFTGVTGARGSEQPYRLTLTAASPGDEPTGQLTWRRRGDALHGDGVAGNREHVSRVHVEVELGRLDLLLPRGALLVLVDVLAVMLLWGGTALADGALGRLLAVRRARWSRSYRVRLSGALLGFFVAPAAIFALWAWYRLQDDDRATRELLVRETLRVAAAEEQERRLGTARSSTGAPLFLYEGGVLTAASDPLLDALAPLGRLLPASLAASEVGSDFGSASEAEIDDLFVTRRLTTGATRALVGFRRLTRSADSTTSPAMADRPVGTLSRVLASPARGNEFALDERREDLGILVLFASMLGALAAVWSSGVAARALARPVGALREAALDIAAGREAPTLGTAPATEFAPVYRAFERMAGDLKTSRAALEAAQRRTAAVLQNVASGVVALRRDGDLLLANPRAEALLGVPLGAAGSAEAATGERATGRIAGDAPARPSLPLSQWPAVLSPLAERVREFLAGGDEEIAFDLPLGTRQLQARLTRLPTGAVLTLDDVTELASAQRVLAWGEMARQVAHEIKNPLTPIRLGVQHLRRAYRDGRADFSQILDRNVSRVLEEIDHLDEIARAFSRYGTAPSERAPAVPVDVTEVVHDVVALERLGDHADNGHRVSWQTDVPDDGDYWALGQRDELREVLINVLENARLAQAGTVTLRVRADEAHVVLDIVDDGVGIAAAVLPQIFEPHFSTRTSGSGLGLAISRRLIEGWGGTVRVTSSEGRGTTVHIALLCASRPAREASSDVAR